jgi:HEAT repeat protein
VLQDLLRDPDPDVRGYAAECLGDYGLKAEAAVPALLGMLGDQTDTGTGSAVGRRATLALIQIDPEAALDAGVDEAWPWVKARRAGIGAADRGGE